MENQLDQSEERAVQLSADLERTDEFAKGLAVERHNLLVDKRLAQAESQKARMMVASQALAAANAQFWPPHKSWGPYGPLQGL